MEPTQTNTTPTKSQRTLFFIIGLVLVTALVLFLAFKKETPPAHKSAITPVKVVPKTTTLTFSPSSLIVPPASGKPISLDLMADSGNSTITGVQVEIVYDPKLITNVSITPPKDGSIFGDTSNQLVLFNKIDPTKGSINYAIAITPQGHSVKGNGKIATVTFMARSINNSKTQLNFTANTLVTQENETQSVLKSVTPFVIQFSSLAPTLTSAPTTVK